MDNRKKSAKNLIYQILGQVITISFGLVLPRLFMTNYGSEVNGLLNSLSQFLVCLSLFEAGIGIAASQALYEPVALNNWDGINGILSAINLYYKRTGRLYLVSLLILSVCYPLLVDSSLSFLTICGAVFFSGIGNVVMFYFQGKYQCLLNVDGRLYVMANLGTIISVLTSMSKVVLIYLHANIVVILAFSFLLHCLQAGYILWYVRRYPRLRLDVRPNTQALSQKNAVLIHQISTIIFRNTDVMILTVVCGLRVVSVYSTFKLITSQLENLLAIPLKSISFTLGQNFQTDRALYIRRIDLVESFYSAALYALMSVTLFLFLPFMRLYTAGVTDINYVDPWLALLFVLISLLDKSRTVTYYSIEYAGHFRATLPYTILESSINLAVSLVGVYFLGIYGVLLGTVVALGYRTNQIILYSNHKVLGRSTMKTYAIYGVNIALFFATQLLFRRCFPEPASYPQFIAVGAAATITAVGVFFAGQSLLMPHCRTALSGLIKPSMGRHFPPK